jgi:hypothetical protein
MGFDRRYLTWALGYAIAGMGVGLYMGASGNHGELVAHAHILLIGFAVSFFYAIIHRLWLSRPGNTLAWVQFVLHQAATFVVSVALLLLYGGVAPEATLGPILGAASSGVLLALVLMLVMVIRAQPQEPHRSM